jgi:hypothetical protein
MHVRAGQVKIVSSMRFGALQIRWATEEKSLAYVRHRTEKSTSIREDAGCSYACVFVVIVPAQASWRIRCTRDGALINFGAMKPYRRVTRRETRSLCGLF